MATRYELLRKLGAGGMAEVFLAKAVNESGFEKLVAFKRALPEMLQYPEARELFQREARLGAQLDHPFIVQVFDGGLKGDQLFLVSEFVDGGDLKEIIEAMRAGGQRLSPQAVALIGSQLCQALAHLFQLRDDAGRPLVVAHRDISPGNVLCTRAGTVKLSDFGVVRTGDSHTQAGVVRGKWDYFPPEVARGVVDGRGDLFAVGVVLYELATLRHPFAAPSPHDRFNRAQASEPDPASELPPALLQVLLRALARDPAKRFQTAEEMGEALEAFLFSSPAPMNSHALARLLAPLQKPPVSHEKDPALASVTPVHMGGTSLYAQMASELAPDPTWSAGGAALDATGQLTAPPERTLISAGRMPAAPPAPAHEPTPTPTPMPPPPPTTPATAPRLADVQHLELADVAPPPKPPEEAPPPPARSRLPLVLGILAVLAVGAGALGIFGKGGRAGRSGEAPMVTVESIPDGAEVFSGKEKLGVTPLVLPNDFKENDLITLEVVQPGYAPGQVTFLGGKPSRVRAVLKKR